MINRFNLNVRFFKVKAHNNNRDNDRADFLAKGGLEDSYVLIKDKNLENKYRLNWYNTTVEENNRYFVKKLNKIRREIDESNLKRFKNLSNLDKKLSYKILNSNKEDQDKKRKFITMNENNIKNFKFKKMLGELPTIEKLKIRKPKLYDQNMNCIRCNKKKETMAHIWECSSVTNDLILFERSIRDWLNDKLVFNKNFNNSDNLIDELYKYTIAEIRLKDYNTEINTKYYRDKGITSKKLTYIWDGNGSLDDLIKGWIPRDLVEIFKKYQIKKNKKDIDEIIIEWANKCHSFFRNIWKKRCNSLIDWEVANNITNIEKRRKNGNKRNLNENRKRKISGKKTAYYHTVDETFYERVRVKIGINLFQWENFRISQDKRVYIFG